MAHHLHLTIKEQQYRGNKAFEFKKRLLEKQTTAELLLNKAFREKRI